jgi:hypothetical protein
MTTSTLLAVDRRRAQRGGVVLWLLATLALLIVLVVGYLAVVLNWAYSEGERSGIVQKFSRKGWLFKTWEGELAMTTVPGVAPVIWNFTVREDDAVAQVSAAIGKRVVLHYTAHRGVPTSLFGETPFFVDGVRLDASPELAVPEM